MSNSSPAVAPLHKAVAEWHRYCDDDNEQDHVSMVFALTTALNRCAAQLEADGDIAVLSVVADCVQACINLAKELGEPVPGEEEAQ